MWVGNTACGSCTAWCGVECKPAKILCARPWWNVPGAGPVTIASVDTADFGAESEPKLKTVGNVKCIGTMPGIIPSEAWLRVADVIFWFVVLKEGDRRLIDGELASNAAPVVACKDSIAPVAVELLTTAGLREVVSSLATPCVPLESPLLPPGGATRVSF